jgi:hypothetical protein
MNSTFVVFHFSHRTAKIRPAVKSKGEIRMIRGTQTAAILAAAIAAAFAGAASAVTDTPKTVQVDCSIPGKTINKALEKGKEDRSLIVLIRGTCNETVLVDRADVTLRGEAGFAGAIVGPDPALDAVTITADRVTIDALTISGGLNGVVVNGAGGTAVRGTTIQTTGRTGIVVVAGSGVLVDGSTLQSNPRDGVAVDGSQATIINSTVRQNTRFGVFVGLGAAVRVGIDLGNNAAGSTIAQNGSTGINVTTGGAALIGNNSITLNGQDLASTAGRSGITVNAGSAEIAGSNTIADNTGAGIFIRGASVNIGNPSLAFSSVNTITGNGDAASAGGVFAVLGSTVLVRDAIVSGNRGFGLSLTLRSQAQVFNSQFDNNVPIGPNLGDGVRVALGSAVHFNAPNSTATGNTNAGLLCTDNESSVLNPAGLNTAGNGNPTPPPCSGF